MGGKSTVWTDPRYEEFVRHNGPLLGWSKQLWRAFAAEFGPEAARGYDAFKFFVQRMRNGGHVVPASTQRDLSLEVLNVKCGSALVCSDWHIDYHDAEWA